MPTLSEQVMGFIAVASVKSDAAAPTYYQQRGFATTAIVRTGAGDYTLTLNDAVNAQTGGIILATSAAGQMASIAVAWLTTTTVRVRSAGLTNAPAIAATDLDFWIAILEIGPN